MLLFYTGLCFKLNGKLIGLGFKVYEDKSKLFGFKIVKVGLTRYVDWGR